MKFCAHFFIGKEFASLVPSVTEQISAGGMEYSSCINLYVIDGKNVIQYRTQPCTDAEIISGKLKCEPLETGKTDLSDKNTAARFFAANIYDRILIAGLTGDTSSLHIYIHFPMYKKEAVHTAFALYDAAYGCSKPCEFEFVGYCDDIAAIIEPSYRIISPSKKQTSTFCSLKRERKLGVRPHLTVIENRTTSGITLGMDTESLAEILAAFAITCAENYDVLFPKTARYSDVVTFGLCRLSLNRFKCLYYLLNRAVLEAMDTAGVHNNDVDINVACRMADKVLSDKTKLLSSIHAAIAGNANTGGSFPEYQQQLEADVSGILDKLKELFEADNNITIRAAVLAAILNDTECSLFSNTIFDQNSLNLNDLYDESINYFVDNNSSGFYTIDSEPITNPVKELKDTTNQLINTQLQAKELQKQLTAIEKNIETAGKVEDCYVEDGIFHFHDHQFRLLPDIKQEPLSETYEPHEVTLRSIDLRSFFNGIKSQGSQGSCLAHALTSIFEYFMKRNSKMESDLSEAFLYYNARQLDTNDDVSVNLDNGSRFKPAMDSLIKYGIALEKYCPYNEDVYSVKPSDAAYEDAAKRLLRTAKNVNSSVADIKSALSDGFPVAVSFSLYDSFFNTTDGYIPMPTQEEIAAFEKEKDEKGEKKNNRHAMVIVGYSDELRMFILRNSWGTDWGDNGYCYVPYAYVENPKLCNYSCVIMEIEQLELQALDKIPSLKVDDSILKIRYIITENAMASELENVGRLRKKKDGLRTYLDKEKKLLSSPNKRDNFIEAVEKKKSEEVEGLNADKKEKDLKRDSLNGDFDKYRKRRIFTSIAVVAGWTVLYLLLSQLADFSADAEMIYLSVYLAGLTVFTVYVSVTFYKKWLSWREERDGLIYGIMAIEKKIRTEEKQIKEFKLKTFTAWALIRALESTESDLQNLYNRTVSLINNLRAWYSESEAALAHCKEDHECRVPTISLMDYRILDKFYDMQIHGNRGFSIDFCKDIDRHSIDTEYLKGYKEGIIEDIAGKLSELQEISGFNISEHIVSQSGTGIGVPVTSEILDKADGMADMFQQIQSVDQGIILPSTYFLAPSLQPYRNQLTRRLDRYNAILCESSGKYDAVIVKTASLRFEECVNLRS